MTGRTGVRRAGPWVALAVLLVLAGAALALVGRGDTAAPLDPASAAPSGSRALVRVLQGYGVDVRATRSLADATADPSSALAVLDPDAYSDAQLRDLTASGRRVVLVEPGTRALHAVSDIEPDTSDDAAVAAEPGCTLPAAVHAGHLRVPTAAVLYLGARRSCYGGLVAASGPLAVLGSAQLLRNDHLDGDGVAALLVNLLSADRGASSVVWLRPGSDARGSGPASVWDLFPSSSHRAFWWLLVVGAVLLLWRGRRLGRAVTEPLPVRVRAAELVEGHGRLYRRAHARDRAADALRRATCRRLAARLGLPAGASAEQVCAALPGTDPALAFAALGGPVPADDARLVTLARDLDRLERALRDTLPTATGRTHP